MPGNIIPITLNQTVLPGQIPNNSMLSVLKRGHGMSIANTVRLTLAGAQQINIWKVNGVVEIQSLFGLIMEATSLTNCTNVYFDLWDGTLSIPLSKTTTTDLSGFNVGSGFYKEDTASVTLATINNATGAIAEFTGKKAFQEIIAMQKLGTDTYIRFCYTAGAAIDTTIYFLSVIEVPDSVNFLTPV